MVVVWSLLEASTTWMACSSLLLPLCTKAGRWVSVLEVDLFSLLRTNEPTRFPIANLEEVVVEVVSQLESDGEEAVGF